MLIYIKLAIRNVHKNLRSVSLNGLGISLTVLVIIFIFSLSRGIENQIVKQNIQFETGGIVVEPDKEIAGWQNKEQGDLIYSKLMGFLNGNPKVKGYRSRITTYNAQFYGNEGSQRVSIEGISGSELPLLNEMIEILEGDTDWSVIGNGVLISTELAEEAGLTLMDECRIVLSSVDGTINLQDFIVTGIFLNTSQRNKYKIYTEYEQAKALYYTNLPSRILIDVVSLDDVDEIAAGIENHINSSEIEVKTYKDFMSTAQSISAINRNSMLGIAFFLLFISFVGCWAMEVEQINERRKEIGTLLTFGFSRQSVKKIFFFETVYVSLLFLALGLVIVLTLIGIINYYDGVNLGRLASFAFGMSTIQPELAIRDISIAVSLVIAYPLLATWISLRAINRIPVIRLLNNRY